MNLYKYFLSAAFSAFILLSSGPAQAGIPVVDTTNLAQQIRQVVAWGQQARDMIAQLDQLRNQLGQLRSMQSKLEGVRNLGTILNNPMIRSVLPPELKDSSRLLLDPASLATSPAALDHILTSFGVDKMKPGSGKAAADTIGRVQQLLDSAQKRETQLRDLASKVDSTADAKDSMDMVNRNVIEAASVNNQLAQTMASLESARQSANLKQIADDQAYYARVKAAGAKPLRTFSF